MPYSYQQGQKDFNSSQDKAEVNPLVHEFKSAWITNQLDSNCIDFAERFGDELQKKGLTTSQIRNVFGEIRRIQLSGFQANKTSFLLLLPKMAYAVKRADKEGAYLFEAVMKKAHAAVKVNESGGETRFSNFCDFAEAILAYHRAKGGREN